MADRSRFVVVSWVILVPFSRTAWRSFDVVDDKSYIAPCGWLFLIAPFGGSLWWLSLVALFGGSSLRLFFRDSFFASFYESSLPVFSYSLYDVDLRFSPSAQLRHFRTLLGVVSFTISRVSPMDGIHSFVSPCFLL